MQAKGLLHLPCWAGLVVVIPEETFCVRVEVPQGGVSESPTQLQRVEGRDGR